MAAGFVHGVLNTDNLTIAGESFDYGPWRFLPASDPSFTAAYFDETGLYSFGRQPEAVSWALAQLGGTLSLVCPVTALEAALAQFAPAYQDGLRRAMFGRLKLAPREREDDLAFLQALFDWLTKSQAGWDQFFHDWIGGEASAARAAESPQAALYQDESFMAVRRGFELRTRDDLAPLLAKPLLQRPAPVSMVIDEVERIWAAIAERDDWSPFEAKLADIAEMRETLGLSVTNL
jgi:uncharacterized protein YdiU (UPF0061 family)